MCNSSFALRLSCSFVLSLSVSVTYISRRWLALQSYSVCRLQLSKRLLVGQAGISVSSTGHVWGCCWLRKCECFWQGGTGRSWKASVMSLWVHAFTAWGCWLAMSNFRGHTPASLSWGCAYGRRGYMCVCWRVSFGPVHQLETWCLICMFTHITV